MNLKKIILKLIIIIILLLIPYSCMTTKDLMNNYPVNSKWKWYYNSKYDTVIVYIDHYSFIEGIIIRDTEVRTDTTIYGKVNPVFLHPIKENTQEERDQ